MKKKTSRGFTLIELMVVVAIIGILAVLAIFGVRKYMANAKTAEARNNLGQLSKDMAAAWEREQMSGTAAEGATYNISHNLCTTPSNTVPASITPVTAAKYQSTVAEWNADQATAFKGFACAKFVIDSPQYYMYGFTTTGNTSQVLTAKGDLNGDGNTSAFSLNGQIVNGRYMPDPSITEVNPEE